MTPSSRRAGMADQPSDKETPSLMESDIVLAASGRRLCARIFERGRRSVSRPGVLFIHGLGSGQSGYRPRGEATARALDAVCLTFDLGGHGDSSGVRDELNPLDHLQD